LHLRGRGSDVLDDHVGVDEESMKSDRMRSQAGAVPGSNDSAAKNSKVKTVERGLHRQGGLRMAHDAVLAKLGSALRVADSAARACGAVR